MIDVSRKFVSNRVKIDQEVFLMHHIKLTRLVVVAVFLIALVAALPVGLVHASSLTLVSGSSPFASCTIGGPGTNYVNAEVEPYVAVNSSNHRNITAVWHQDPWNNRSPPALLPAPPTHR